MKHSAVFGSAFNPVHTGHIDAIKQLLEDNFDEVLVTPSVSHAFGKQMLAMEQRRMLLDIALNEARLDRKRVIISNAETHLSNLFPNKPVYTYDVLMFLKEKAESLGEEIKYVPAFGPDNLIPATWSRFYKHYDIEKTFGIHEVKERIHIRSSLCRVILEAHYAGEYQEQLLTECFSPAVASTILERNLYA